jgi:hypothetical protein
VWARISEIILGIWLIASYFLFATDKIGDFITAFFVILFASLSYIEKINKIHLFQVLPAAWLLYLGYAYPTPWLPFYMQNYLLVALCILMFAIVPSHASDHPRAWKRFLKSRSKE